jgi:hypothetical protein
MAPKKFKIGDVVIALTNDDKDFKKGHEYTVVGVPGDEWFEEEMGPVMIAKSVRETLKYCLMLSGSPGQLWALGFSEDFKKK